MNTKNSLHDIFHAPLIATLKRLEIWLEQDNASRIVVAQPTVEKMLAKHLPSYVEVIYKKRVGKRKPYVGGAIIRKRVRCWQCGRKIISMKVRCRWWRAAFTRYFKKETGETFGSYQQRRRMEVAEGLLETTNLTVLHICQRIGLQYSQMRKLFQKKHGLSPIEYRERKN